MAAFKVGDRVRCVDESGERDLKHNAVYTVCGIQTFTDTPLVSLSEIESKSKAYRPERFELLTNPAIMVPVDPALIAEGYEAVGIRKALPGESGMVVNGVAEISVKHFPDGSPFYTVVVRRKYQPTISIQKGWWVYPVDCETWFTSDSKPFKCNGYWSTPLGSNNIKLSGLNFVPPSDGQPRQVT